METNLLRTYNKIHDIIEFTCPENAFRVDDEGYEYIDPDYIPVYETIYDQTVVWTLMH